jgi:hypothetical protein
MTFDFLDCNLWLLVSDTLLPLKCRWIATGHWWLELPFHGALRKKKSWNNRTEWSIPKYRNRFQARNSLRRKPEKLWGTFVLSLQSLVKERNSNFWARNAAYYIPTRAENKDLEIVWSAFLCYYVNDSDVKEDTGLSGFRIYSLPASVKIKKKFTNNGTIKSVDLEVEGTGILYEEENC